MVVSTSILRRCPSRSTPTNDAPTHMSRFRGAAPLHHMLLAGRQHIGLSLQTLHPTAFDGGTILVQTAGDGFEIPQPETITVPELSTFAAPKAGAMLVQALRDRVYVPPYDPVEPKVPESQAPKITPEMGHIDWSSWTADQVMRRQRVLGRVWNVLDESSSGSSSDERRLIWSSPFERVIGIDGTLLTEKGQPVPDSAACLPTVDNQILMSRHMIVGGRAEKPSRDAMKREAFHHLRPNFSLGKDDPWWTISNRLK